MNIENFLPKYPNINNKTENILNPYEDDFYGVIFKKKEFYDERIPIVETFPLEKGMLTKHQTLVARFLSSHTIYDSLLLVHEMGTGKTCAAIGAIEQIKNEANNFKGAYIFAKGKNLLGNFITELRDKCTAGQYIPERLSYEQKQDSLTEREKTIRTRKLYEDYYHFSIGPNKPTTFETFAKHLHKLKDADITAMYSNYIIVIDEVHNLRIQDYTEGDRISMYTEFHRFLHLVKNCKILLLSGTPMKDTPDEIASVMNLILPLGKDQLPTGDKFLTTYLDFQGKNLYTVKQTKVKSLKKRFKGRVSYVKAVQSTVKKEFIGKPHIGKLKYFIVDPVQMSKKQTNAYTKALELDLSGGGEKTGVYYNSRQASLFVFPDDSYGQPKIPGKKIFDPNKGFFKYVTRQKNIKTFDVEKLSGGKKKQKPTYTYKLNKDLISAIQGKTDEETLEKLAKFSAKYASVIRSILNAKNQSCFVYSELVSGSGSIIFAEILKLFGFTAATGREAADKPSKKPTLRFGLLTHKTANTTQIRRIINRFNQKDNMHGDVIKVLIGSRVVSEGVSFYNVQQEFIMTPWFNYSETEQAIARGYRYGSHKMLLDAGENPTVYISQLVAMPRKPKENVFSIDLDMYETSEDKDITIKKLLRYLMESSFDCALTYQRNHVNGIDKSRECDYQECDYVCDGIDMKNIEDELPIDEIDDSTYQLYYADPKISHIHKKLQKLFKTYNDVDIDTIIKYFEGEYNEEEIRNALTSIINKSNERLYFKDYINLYARSDIQKIIIGIEKLFQTNFRMNLTNILLNFPKYTEFEVLTALKNIIDESIVIKNKYGFSSYLREYKNIYFLVNNLTITNDYFSDYYTRVPNIINTKPFSEILNEVQMNLLPNYIDMMCKITKPSTFFKKIKAVPDNIQEIMIESAISAENKNINTGQIFRKFILEYFVSYIHKLDNVWLSNRLEDEDILRCLENDKWGECDEKYDSLLQNKLKERKNTLESNPWGYYGKYNNETNTFSIVNVIAQQEKFKKEENEKIKSLEKQVEKGEITEEEKEDAIIQFSKDNRLVYPGRNCMQGWGIPELLRIGVRSLKFDYPENYEKGKSDSKLREMFKKNKYLSGNPKTPALYTPEELEKLDGNELRRALYWAIKKPGIGQVKELCTEMEKWFRNRKWDGFDMLIPDKQVGTSGGHTKKEIIEVEEKKNFIIRTFIPEQQKDIFISYQKDIEKIMSECYGIKKFIPDIDNKKWITVFLRKKMVGFLVVDTQSNVIYSCIAKNYRKIAKEAMQTVVNVECQNKPPKLTVNNIDKKYKKLIKMYTQYGFTISSNNGKITIMEFECT